MLMFFGKQENIPALDWWGTAYLLGAASVALWTLGRPEARRRRCRWRSTRVGFVACGMVWNAARVFHGRKPNLAGAGSRRDRLDRRRRGVAAGSRRMRMTIGAGIVAIYAALTAAELWSERRKSMQRRWPAIVVPLLHGGVLMLPILLGDLLRPHDETFASSIWVTVFSIELVLYAVGTVFVIFMLVSERDGDRAQDRGVDRSADRPVQSPRLRRSLHADDRARGRRRPSGDGDDLRHRPFQSRSTTASAIRRATKSSNCSPTVVINSRCASPICRAGSAARNSPRCCRARWKRRVVAAERVREAFETPASWSTTGRSTTTVSIGVAGGPARTELDVLLAAADTALYQAKRGGRNRVEAAEEQPLSLENWRRKTAGFAAPAAASRDGGRRSASTRSRRPSR